MGPATKQRMWVISTISRRAMSKQCHPPLRTASMVNLPTFPQFFRSFRILAIRTKDIGMSRILPIDVPDRVSSSSILSPIETQRKVGSLIDPAVFINLSSFLFTSVLTHSCHFHSLSDVSLSILLLSTCSSFYSICLDSRCWQTGSSIDY